MQTLKEISWFHADPLVFSLLQVQHYIFVAQAQDSGRPSLSSTLTVYFNVLDLNDNAPLFDPMSYSNEVFENVTVGTSVVTVSATDLDSGSLSSSRIN
jgi:protocadherin Fat 4